MKLKIFTLNLSLCLVAQNGFAQTPDGEGESKKRPSRVYLVPEGGSYAVSQKDAARMKDSEAATNSAKNVVLDLALLGMGKITTGMVGSVVNTSKRRSAALAENKILEATKTGLGFSDYNLALYGNINPANGMQFAKDLESLKKKAVTFGDNLTSSELFQFSTQETPGKSADEFKKALLKTDTERLQKEALAFKKEIKDFMERWPGEVEKINYLKAYLKAGVYDFEKLNNLRISAYSGTDTIDKFDLESAEMNLRNASNSVDEVIKADNRLIEVTANKKIANEIKKLKTAVTPSRSLKVLKAAGWFGAGFIAVDVYGNILNFNSDNPKPDVVMGQLGTEILMGTPEAIFEAAKKAIAQNPAADLGTVDELDPTSPKKEGH
jgi:hypothetical protein